MTLSPTQEVVPTVTPARNARVFDWRDFLGRYGAILALVAMIVAFAIDAPSTFATKSNLINVVNQSALAGIISIGLTFTLVAGQLDLSVGYCASLGGIVAADLLSKGVAIPLAFLAAIAVGCAVGLTNGLVVTQLGVNPLIATLGIGTVAIGFNFAISGGIPIAPKDPATFVKITQGKFLGLPYPIYMLIFVAIVAWLVLNRTEFGLSTQAVGGNAEAAHLSGVNLSRIRILTFMIAGAAAAITGVLLASRTGSASSDVGDGYLLTAFSASFFGSAVLRQGQFHIIGTVLGVLTVQIGLDGIAILGFSTYYQYLFQGTLLIVAVGLATTTRRNKVHVGGH